MKKVFNCFTIIICFLVFGSFRDVFAVEINVDDISNSTYIIGKCMFTREVSESYSGSLSTDVIMLAAKTIDSDNLEDMIIYYKNARGNWINALTNEAVEMPEKVNLRYKNNELFLETPKLLGINLSWCGSGEAECQTFIPKLTDSGYEYDFGIDINSIQQSFDEKIVSNYIIYEKNGTAYSVVSDTEIGTVIPITVQPGERKVFVARVYAIKSNGDKVYSDYSNEVVIDHTEYETPKLKNVTIAACGNESECQTYIPNLSEGEYSYELGIENFNSYTVWTGFSSESSVSGYEVYEKNGTAYSVVSDTEIGGPILITIQPGERKVFVARVYATKSNGDKVYSDYSEELVIDHSKYEAPTLKNISAIACGSEPECQPFIPKLEDGVYHYDIGIDEKAYRKILGNTIQVTSVSGYEIYEKNGTKYESVGGGPIGNPAVVVVSVAVGEKKEFVARVYATKSNGDKVYSDYSEKLVIDHSEG